MQLAQVPGLGGLDCSYGKWFSPISALCSLNFRILAKSLPNPRQLSQMGFLEQPRGLPASWVPFWQVFQESIVNLERGPQQLICHGGWNH